MNENIDKKDLKKSYKLLALWFSLFFLFVSIFITLLIILDLNISIKVITIFWLYFTNLFLISLFLMIYKTERVYYINNITFKETQEATGEERRAFAYKHLMTFSIATLVFIIYSIVSFIFQYHTGVDIAAWTAILIISAIRTIPFKLKGN